MRRSAQLHGVVAGAAAFSLLGSAVALADTVRLGPDVAKAPGSTGTFVVSLVVDDNSTDGVNGCNAGGGDKVSVSFTSSAPAVVAAPAAVLVAGCDDLSTAAVENGVTVSYAVAAGAADAATATITAVATGGKTVKKAQTTVSGSFTGDSFTVTVQRPAPTNTAPVVGVTGVTAQAYEFGTLPAAGCSVTDVEDGTAAAAIPVITGALVNGLGTQTATCSYTDSGSPALTGTASVTYSVVDTVLPTIAATLTPTVPDTGWYNAATGAPTASFTCDDAGSSGIATCSDSVLLTEGRARSATGTAVDHGGNQAQATAGPVDIDLTAPAAPTAEAGQADHEGADGRAWYRGSATVTFTGTSDPALADGSAGSGIASTTAPVTRSTTGELTASGTSTDVAGNVSESTSATAWVDATAPVVVVGASRSVLLNSTGQSVSWSASDADSGLDGAASGAVALDTSSVGSKTVQIPAATDNVGNVTAAQSYTYEVSYSYSGLLQPINIDGRSSFKAGSTIPVKFQVTDANRVVQSAPGIAATLRVTKLDSVPDGPVNEEVISATGDAGTSFRWDSTSLQYVFNLSTRNWSGTVLGEGTYRLDVVSGGKVLTAGTIHIRK